MDVALVLATVASAWIAWLEHTQKRDVLVETAKLSQDLTQVQGELKQKKAELDEQRRKNLETFFQFYKQKVAEAANALDEYRRYDTPENRREAGQSFERNKTAKFDAFREKVEAFVTFIKVWKGVLDQACKMTDGNITLLEQSIVAKKNQAIIGQFGIIRDNAESELARLRQGLDSPR